MYYLLLNVFIYTLPVHKLSCHLNRCHLICCHAGWCERKRFTLFKLCFVHFTVDALSSCMRGLDHFFFVLKQIQLNLLQVNCKWDMNVFKSTQICSQLCNIWTLSLPVFIILVEWLVQGHAVCTTSEEGQARSRWMVRSSLNLLQYLLHLIWSILVLHIRYWILV